MPEAAATRQLLCNRSGVFFLIVRNGKLQIFVTELFPLVRQSVENDVFIFKNAISDNIRVVEVQDIIVFYFGPIKHDFLPVLHLFPFSEICGLFGPAWERSKIVRQICLTICAVLCHSFVY